ncbi:hypothetical protein PI125_g15472 [Phytophthora idaei]|nr:hypothetical protein PI125_g15472 [Phytophthora idaei]
MLAAAWRSLGRPYQGGGDHSRGAKEMGWPIFREVGQLATTLRSQGICWLRARAHAAAGPLKKKETITSTTRNLFNKIKFIVGEASQMPDPTSSPRISQPAPSNYASAAEEDLDTSSEPRRMSLGPSGASMLEIQPDLLRNFQTQYCTLGVSVAPQYYHARQRSDASPLEYLHRLNVVGLRAHLKIKDGGSKVLREHVDHFIETLGDPDLADRLTLLRLPDADEREEVLRALDRAKHRHKKSVAGSNKFCQRAPAPMAPASRARKVQVADSGTEPGSDGPDSDPDSHPRICLATGEDRASKGVDDQKRAEPSQIDRRLVDLAAGDRGAYRSRGHQDAADPVRCSQCGSRKHTESGCWRHLFCQKGGKKGHPGDHCFYVRRGCGELHKVDEARVFWKKRDQDRWFEPAKGEITSEPPKIRKITEVRHSGVMGVPGLLPGESRGYWKYHAPGKWFRQAKVGGKINNEESTMLLDSCAEVSILDTAFAHKVGCHIDRSQVQDCVGIGENVYTTNGRTRIKITLAGCLVYNFDIWAGDLAGQDPILGMDFMVPAGVRLDLADGTMCFPDEMRIQLSGRHLLYGEKMIIVRAGKTRWIGSAEIWE